MITNNCDTVTSYGLPSFTHHQEEGKKISVLSRPVQKKIYYNEGAKNVLKVKYSIIYYLLVIGNNKQ